MAFRGLFARLLGIECVQLGLLIVQTFFLGPGDQAQHMIVIVRQDLFKLGQVTAKWPWPGGCP